MLKSLFFILIAFAIASAGFLSPDREGRLQSAVSDSIASDDSAFALAFSRTEAQRDDKNGSVSTVRTAISLSSRRNERVASLHTEELMRSYLQESLAPVPALMFAPAAFQLSFSQIVNLPIDESGNTFLHLASRFGDPYFTWQLLEFGASPHLRNQTQRRAFDLLDTGIPEAEQYLSRVLRPGTPALIVPDAITPASAERSEIAGRNLPFRPLQPSDTETAHQAHEISSPDGPAVI